MHMSALASVHETVPVTDGVVGESLIADSNVAPPSRYSLINGVPGSIQDNDGERCLDESIRSSPIPARHPQRPRFCRVACHDYLSPAEATLIYLHNLARSPKLLRKERQWSPALPRGRTVSIQRPCLWNGWRGGVTEECLILNESTENKRVVAWRITDVRLDWLVPWRRGTLFFTETDPTW
jgi:hypothetical protein